MFLLSGALGGEENYYSKISGCCHVVREQQGLLFSERMSAVLLKYVAVHRLKTALATQICYIVRATSPFGLFP